MNEPQFVDDAINTTTFTETAPPATKPPKPDTRRIIGVIAVGPEWVPNPYNPERVIKVPHNGKPTLRQSVDGRQYVQLPNGEVRRVPPKVHNAKKLRRAAKRIARAKLTKAAEPLLRAILEGANLEVPRG